MFSVRASLLSACLFWLAACAQRAPSASATTPSEQLAEAGQSDAIETQELVYHSGQSELKGYLAYPRGVAEKRPGVLVVHEWWGLNDYARMRARKLAELGYVALAADIYGGGRSAEHPSDAKALMSEVMADPEEVGRRFQAGLAALSQDPHVEPSKLAAIGYCMGGAIVLAAARNGAVLDLAASFHGNYATKQPMAKDAFQGKLFIAHGAADTFSTPEQVAALKSELSAAGADYEFVAYEGAKHGFTNPAASEAGKRGGIDLAYDPRADSASWEKLQQLLADAFAKP